MAERAEERLELSDGPAVYLRRSSHRLTALGMIGHYTKIVLAAGAEHAGVVDQNGDGRAKSPGDEGLPEVEGPGLIVAANLGETPKGGIIEITRLGVVGFRLEQLHLAPEDRATSDSTILLRCLELLLLTSTSVTGLLAESRGYVGQVVLH